MKKIITLLAICLCWSSLASAEMKIGVVDVRTALLSSNAAKKFREEMQNEFKDDYAKLSELGEEGQKLKDRLEKDAAILSEVERRRLGLELKKKAEEFTFMKNQLESTIQSRETEFLQESKPRMDAAIEQIIKTEKLDLVLSREVALYANPSLDYTTRIIDILNKQ